MYTVYIHLFIHMVRSIYFSEVYEPLLISIWEATRIYNYYELPIRK